MKTIKLALAAGILITALAPTAPAGHSVYECPYFGAFILPEKGYDESYPVYVTFDGIFTDGQLLHVWIYAESNGVEAVQRHDFACQTEGWEDPDEILF